MTRILFTSNPGLGHIHPMVPLAAALAGRGHEVRWAVAPDVCSRLEAAGFATFPAGMGGPERAAEFERRFAETRTLPPEKRPDHMFPAFFGESCSPVMLRDLLPVVDHWRPAVIVRDAAEFAAPLAAALTGVPHVTHAFGALVPEHRVAAASAAVAPLWEAHGLDPRRYGGSYDHLYLDIYPPSMRFGSYEHVPQVQPLRPVPFDAVEGEHAEPAGGGGRPLVYLTFGTVFNDASQFSAAIAGVARHDVDVLVTVGPRGDPARLGSVPPNVQVERYVPQTSVLSRCAAVASHAGSGTFLASLGVGVPQLCLPQAADQFINAGQGAKAGAALKLVPAEASVDAIADAVGRLLHERAFTDAARRIGDEIAGMPSPDDVAAILEDLW
ncbi:MAG: glycosyltransferase [Acidimicrobiales bacterium]